MANLNYFATWADHKAVVDFIFASTDLRMFECYSRFDQELREFRSFEELAADYEADGDPSIGGFLGLWSPSIAEEPQIERITLDSRRCKGHTFRYRIDGWLIRLNLGGLDRGVIARTNYAHVTEAHARKWGSSRGVDWPAFDRLSRKIQYHIRTRLAVVRVLGCPVLPEAYAYARSGYELRYSYGSTLIYKLPEVEQ